MNEIMKELLDALKYAASCLGTDGNDPIDITIAKAEAALAAAQPDDDGWIPWAGGERPVDTIVAVKFRSGGIGTDHACLCDWRHVNAPDDIVAYQVAQQSEESGS